MATPTAIPHAENSTHHRDAQQPRTAAAAIPRSNSPPLVSPVYSRTAFSLPGAPMVSPGGSSSFRNTANGWTPTGVGMHTQASVSGSPTSAIRSQTIPQRDTFPERRNSLAAARHSRAFSGSSASGASLSSSTSSMDSFGGPQTPRNTSDSPMTSSTSGAPLGRMHSVTLATSPYEAMKARRESWAAASPPTSKSAAVPGGWPGFGILRGNRSPPANQVDANDLMSVKSKGTGAPSTSGPVAGGGDDANSGGMSGLFKKLNIGAGSGAGASDAHSHSSRHHHGHMHGQRSASVSSATQASTSPATASAASMPSPTSPTRQTRGRQASVGANGKRKPSPHGERLLMGWTHAH